LQEFAVAFWFWTGTIAPFAGLAVPVGWLLCDGTSLERRKYPALFGAI
jgi:microcystin-dependent protein